MGKQKEDTGATSVSMDTSKKSSSSATPSEATFREEKYGLRPRTLIKRLQQERTPEVPKKQQRSKSRPAPLSKYRRKTANARERHRMREINNAFESLRKALPEDYETRVSNTMTKISTLKLAVQYIQALSRVLSEASDTNFYSLESSRTPEGGAKQHYESQVTPALVSNPLPGIPSQQSCFLQSTVSLSSSSSSFASFSSSSSSTSCRGSLSSSSDLEEFLSDDSALLEDSLDVFHDIKPLPGPDPFELLLNEGKENLIFSADFCTFK